MSVTILFEPAGVQTADGTEVVAGAFEIPLNSIADVDIMVLAKTSALGSKWEYNACAKNVGSGAQLVGSSTKTVTRDSGTTSWTMNVVPVGDTLEVRVKGASGVDIDWLVSVDIAGLQS